MTGLVDDLLDVSRVTRGLVEIDKIPQDARSWPAPSSRCGRWWRRSATGW